MLGLNVPAGQGLGVLLPSEQNEPVGHERHSDDELLPLVDEKVPAGQGSQVRAPDGAYDPSEHSVHGKVRPLSPFAVPAGHHRQSVAKVR